MYYEKKIKYLDYFERGERIRGGGHVKLEARDGRLRLELNVTGMHATDSFVRDVLFCSDRQEKAVGKIEISGGSGNCRQQWDSLRDIGGTGISYEELCGIRILLGAGREVSCRWQCVSAGRMEMHGQAGRDAVEIKGDGLEAGEVAESRDRQEKAEPEESRDGLEAGEVVESRDRQEKAGPEESRDGLEAGEVVESRRRQEAEERRDRQGAVVAVENRDKENHVRGKIYVGDVDLKKIRVKRKADRREFPEEKESALEKDADRSGVNKKIPGQNADMGKPEQKPSEGGGEYGRRKREGDAQKPVKLLDNKWAQLWAIYPHIKPFHDEREYISIGPSDFVLFPEESYRIVNNSFLLHGYYNYHHLLLAKMVKKGETRYYIGVPGCFFEKEKQVAVMFGFESFECAEEPAQAGDFGYYMMQTGL